MQNRLKNIFKKNIILQLKNILNMKKILITGGLGNLGSWLTAYFAEQACEVWVLAKNYRKLDTKAKYHLIHCDLADYQDVCQKLKDTNFDIVIHAGSVNDGFVADYFKLALEVNVLGTRNLLEFFKDKKIENFIYFSTFQVYGKYSGTITENTPTEPKNDYGATHLFAEYYIKQFFYSHQLPHCILRLSNSYGCPKDYKSSKWYLVLNDLSKSAFEKKQITLKSNGLAPRDFIWMGDVAKIVFQIATTKATNNIYNIAGEKTYTMLQIATFVQQAYQIKYAITVPITTNLADTTTYPTDLKVSASKLKSAFDYTLAEMFAAEATAIFEFLEKQSK